MNIQWYPGHMAKTRRLISEHLKLVDVAVELLDARIPYSSANPVIGELLHGKPRVVALNKCDMADEAAVSEWVLYYKERGVTAVPVDSIRGRGIGALKNEVRNTLLSKTRREAERACGERPRG